jgi:antitoxin ParD1/3/4
MNLNLGDHFENYIRERVASGEYNNASEFVRETLRARMEEETEIAEIRAAIAQARQSGDLRPFDAARIRELGMKKLLAHQAGA